MLKEPYIVNIVDLLGRETSNSKLKIEIYNDGSVNKVYKIN